MQTNDQPTGRDCIADFGAFFDDLRFACRLVSPSALNKFFNMLYIACTKYNVFYDSEL